MSEPEPKQPRDLLLAEDEGDIAMVTGILGRIHGVNIHHGKNGKEALELAKQMGNKLGGAIVDLRMPEMNGDELLKELGRAGIGVPAVMVSGGPETRDPEVRDAMRLRLSEIRAERPFGIMEKPVAPERLTQVIKILAKGDDMEIAQLLKDLEAETERFIHNL